ncbi:hypothetical protein HYALB_00006837 [Hymenoscyphus albidus]|uniref:Hard-surface induced protein 5 n=1 Tax=Hymenoscyphus albidus TaxID=595503 RepID=A0A9N9LHK8_9HELO|nr:hypothetical protein HYALB_00006837 [Hymenoscyphus albidus]
MAKSPNCLSISACVGIIFIFATLWSLQNRPEYIDALRNQVQPTGTDGEAQAQAPVHKLPPVSSDSKTYESVDHEGPVSSGKSGKEESSTKGGKEESSEKKGRPSFTEIAMKWGTDKVTGHNYHYMYEKYMEPIRDRKIKMLEIGLGCNMNYGPGMSYHTWLEFFPNVDLYYIEYDAACVERWGANITDATIFTGDQSSLPFLQHFISASGGGFDIIIDDGGHTMTQQITSAQTLFPIIKPGGIYFLEDLGTSYLAEYGATPGARTAMDMVTSLIHDLNADLSYNNHKGFRKNAFSESMRGVECGEEICAFFKKEMPVGHKGVKAVPKPGAGREISGFPVLYPGV